LHIADRQDGMWLGLDDAALLPMPFSVATTSGRALRAFPRSFLVDREKAPAKIRGLIWERVQTEIQLWQ